MCDVNITRLKNGTRQKIRDTLLIRQRERENAYVRACVKKIRIMPTTTMSGIKCFYYDLMTRQKK